jgi:hypothetical protein
MINVPDPFTLSVAYMTTDAMPSDSHGETCVLIFTESCWGGTAHGIGCANMRSLG